MSRGPGRHQRLILEHVQAGHLVAITNAGDPPSVKSARLRAAKILEAAGKIALTDMRVRGVRRLVAGPPEDPRLPPSRTYMGLDGKHYRVHK